MSKYINDHSLSVGYNNTGQEFFDLLKCYERYIHSYFFSLTEGMRGDQYNIQAIFDNLRSSNTYNFPANLILNTYHSETKWDMLISIAKDITNLKSVTVLSLEIAKLIRIKHPELEIHLSVRFWDWQDNPNCISIIKEKESEFKKYIDVINISGCWSYNDYQLSQIIKDIGIKTKFIVNEGCINKRYSNYINFKEFSINRCYDKPCNFYCKKITNMYPWLDLTRITLYKESLKYYNYDILKISTREQSNDNIEKLLRYWVTDYDTSFIYGIDISTKYNIFLEWIKQRSICSNDCYNCKKCEEFYNKFIN